MSEVWRNPIRPLGLVPARRRSPAGFTLIELLVVVSIIALLLAILLPSLRAAKDQAKTVKCLANLHAIHLAMVCYAQENRGFLPPFDTYGGWGFRCAPGRKTSNSVYPETQGVQAVLQSGYGPGEVMGNGLRRFVQGKPVYLAGDSNVWVCPSNPGPAEWANEWASWGNSYFYRTMNTDGSSDDSNATTDTTPKDWKTKEYTFYSLEYWNKNATRAAGQAISWDNYKYRVAASGMSRPGRASDYQTKLPERAPHRASSVKKGASNFWCANFMDGHCQMNAFNQR